MGVEGGGLASEDKVCESCGQIFSCEAAFLEHRKKKSCGSPCEVVIEALKGLRCPIKDCCMDFATYDALRIHHIDKHSSVDPYSKAKEEDIEKKRCGEESNNVGSTEVVLYGLKAGRTSQVTFD
ncbi:unnamed protein product [Toxocara canis]|uniref:C2H2-type domain-containing protein n=1 Tax=Toxocara canis TaxID=6265 RepID=A0A183U2C8_TOXCA|nr:unnamed protein product [Toxocara canis]